jgi:hypothetical protein
MPVLKIIPEPRFVREGRTKVFEVILSERYWLRIVHCRFGDETYRAETREARHPVFCGQCQRPRHWHNIRFRRATAQCANSFVRAVLINGANSDRAASTDTTATAISYAGYFLLKYPQTWKTLCHEVRREFGSVEEITQARLSSVPYLNAVIQEGTPQIDPPNRSLADETSSSVRSATSRS